MTSPEHVVEPHPALPAPLTSMVGRHRELGSLEALLDTTRLLTLTGPGGSGKTRLALALATRVGARFPDGVVWVDLTAVQDPGIVTKQVAAALGMHDQADLQCLAALRSALSARTLLLILDNCEQVVDACASIVENLLHGCRGLKIVTTSREVLSVPGEVGWMVPTLALPPAGLDRQFEQVAHSEAVQLFVDRARGVLPAFELTETNAPVILQICRALDGIPLALELAAARVRVVSPEQIVHRLHDVLQLLNSGPRTAATRHRTLRATIDWSYQLLTDREKLLFERLSVFPSGFTLEAVEGICSDERIGADEVLDLMALLVEKSLVNLEDHGSWVRYRLLETLRQYGRERLRERGEEREMARRHAGFFGALAVDSEPHLMVLDPAWTARVGKDYENIRAALSWSFGPGADPETGVAISAALRWFWYYTIAWTEGTEWMERAAVATDAAPNPAARAALLWTLGTIASYRGEQAVALARLRESESLWRALGEERQLTYVLSSLVHLGSTCRSLRMDDESGVGPLEPSCLAEKAVGLARENGVAWDIGYVLATTMAFVAFERGEYAAADAALAEAESLFRGIAGGAARGLVWVLNARAQVALRQGDLGRVVELARDALAPRGEMPDAWFASRALRTLAYVHLQQGTVEQAITLLSGSDALLTSLGVLLPRRELPEYEKTLAEIRDLVPAETFAAAWRAGSRMTLADTMLAVTAAGVPTQLLLPQTDVVPAWQPISPTPIPSPQPVATSAHPELLVNALGPLQIYRNGTLLEQAAWASAKPREILLFLLCHPQGCTKEQIGLALWPDASAVQVRNNFHNTLHRLRKTLGEGEWISYAGDRYRVDPPGGCEFDAAVFEQELTAALRELRSGGDAAARLQDALAHYRGDFLEHEVVGDWHLAVRDRLKRLYETGLETLGEHHMAAEQYAAARDVFQRLLLADDLNEGAYRRLMTCLAHLGERMNALRLYQRLLFILDDELATTPEHETTDLFERLQRGEELPSLGSLAGVGPA